LTIEIVRILFPGTGFLVLAAWCLGVLNSHRRFLLSYASGVMWNVAMIVTLIAFGAREALPRLAVLLAWGSVAGSVLQFAVQVPVVIKVAPDLRFAIDARSDHVRTVVAFFVVPSAMAFLALGDVVAAALFQTGRFRPSDARYLWGILAGSAVGLLASTLGRLYASTYYAMRDTRTPLRYALVRVALTTVLGYL